ncbi:MAG: hypothetical protein GY832_30965 [Chloroflexi bacterium]|nr:hypothetical protein [Chloroflexota bacterium]
MAKPSAFVKYPNLTALNLAAGETSNAAKRVDGDHSDGNFLDSNNALSRRGFFGIDCADNGSIASECRLTVQTAAGNGGLVRAGDEFIVSDGTGWWRGQATGADDIRFSASDRIQGTDPADFSTGGFIDSLEGEVNLPAVKYIGVNEVATGNHPNALNGDDIPTSKTDATSLATKTADLDTRMSVSIDAGGALETDAVTLDTLAADTLATEGFEMLISNGGFEIWDKGTSAWAAGWEAWNACVMTQSLTPKSGAYCAQLDFTSSSQGAMCYIRDPTAHAGKDITTTSWIKLASGTGQVRMVMWTGSGWVAGATVTATSSWQQISVTGTVSAAPTEVRLYVTSVTNAVYSILVDEVAPYNGVQQKGYGPYSIPLAADDVRPHQLLFPRSFQGWNNGAGGTDLPDGWEKYGSGTLSISSSTMNSFLGNLLNMSSATANSTGVKQDLGQIDRVLAYLKGKTVTFSLLLAGNASTVRDLTIAIVDSAGSTTATVDATEYTSAGKRIWVTHGIDSGATSLEVQIYYSGGTPGAGAVRIGNPLLNIGSRPAPWTGENPSIWNPVSYTWSFDGTVSSFPTQESSPVFVMPADMYPLGISAYWETGAQGSFPFATLEHILRKISDGGSWADAGIQLDYLTTAAIPGDQIIAMALTDLADVQSAKIDYNEAIAMQIDQTAGFTGNPKEGTVTLFGYTITL